MFWDDQLLIGHEMIDCQHKGLFALADRLYEAECNRAPQDVVCEVLCELADYSMEHFSAEENLMRIASFPHFAEHLAEHWSFIQKITILINDYERGKPSIQTECRVFLVDWLCSHILIEDKKFSEFLKNSRVRALAMAPNQNYLFRERLIERKSAYYNKKE